MKKKLPHYAYLYFFCQAINLTAAVMSFSVTASASAPLAPHPSLITVPYGMQFTAILLATYPMALFMRQKGRKAGFMLGAFMLIFAGLVGIFAMIWQSFILLIIAHCGIGIFTAAANYYRFAITDDLPPILQPRALSLVVAGGVLAGFLGPSLSSLTQDIDGFPRFIFAYGVLILLALINLILIKFLPKPKAKPIETPAPLPETTGKTPLFSLPESDRKDIIFVAICVSAFSYLLMTLLMVQSSLKMNHLHLPFEDTAFALQWHVVAMFLPSFFTGTLITKYGHRLIIFCGLWLFIASFLLNIYGPHFASHYGSMVASLILLGLGWNFTYVGGSALLTLALQGNSAFQKWQGIGDTSIAIFATIGAFSPSFMMAIFGWETSNFIAIGLIIIPIISLIFLKKARLAMLA